MPCRTAGPVAPHGDNFPTPREVVAHDISEALDGFMTVPVGHGRLAPKYGIGHTQQLGSRALLLHEAGGVGPDVYGDHEQGVGGASAGKEGGGDTAGGNSKSNSPPGANSGKNGAAKEGLVSTSWPVDEEETTPCLIRWQNAASPALLAEEGVGSHDANERSALLSIEVANTLVLQSPQLVVVVPG